jgi:hypothetical protein
MMLRKATPLLDHEYPYQFLSNFQCNKTVLKAIRQIIGKSRALGTERISRQSGRGNALLFLWRQVLNRLLPVAAANGGSNSFLKSPDSGDKIIP